MAKKSVNPLDQRLQGKFTLGAKAKNGVWMTLVDMVDDPLGVAVKVISTDSEAHKRQRQKVLEKYNHKSQAWKDKNLRKIVGEFQAKSVVLDWWFYDVNDDDVIEFEDANKPTEGQQPYDASQLSEWLGKKEEDATTDANNLIEQIDGFTTNAANFRDDPEPGKSVNSSGSPSAEPKS